MTAKTPAERSSEYRARKRAGVSVVYEPCPSRAAALRHRRNGETVCDGCKAKEREYGAAAQRRRRARTATEEKTT